MWGAATSKKVKNRPPSPPCAARSNSTRAAPKPCKACKPPWPFPETPALKTKSATHAALICLLFFLAPLPAQPARVPNSRVDITSTGEGLSTLRLERVFADISFSSSVYLTHAGDGSGRIFVVERNGIVRVLPAGGGAAGNFLDIRDRVRAVPLEAGLFCLAFHPDYRANGRLFAFYTHHDGSGLSVRLAEFGVSPDDPDRALPASERVLLSVPQPAPSHNGGQIAFGPDGMLYLSLGDGEDPNDPHRHGQDRGTLLGSILRLDVDRRDPGLEYAVPPDNPFAALDDGSRPEIWAYGLRNPWRFSFDRLDGALWAGDVGQNTWEEINRVEKGGNYGWSQMEGFHCFPPGSACDPAAFDLPFFEYNHAEGLSVTGGYVYRGSRLPDLQGSYVFGDFASRRVWALDPGQAPAASRLLGTSPSALVSFGEDEDGELYVVGFDGRIYRLAPKEPGGADTVPATISASGVFEDLGTLSHAPGLLPYRVRAPLWSDGAGKTRLLALPGDEKIAVDSSGVLVFPPKTVFVKNFFVGEKPVETRLLVKRPAGEEWDGYSYIWEGGDARLLANDTTAVYDVDGGRQTHLYPSRAQCNTCHTPQAGYVLGFSPEQLGADFIEGLLEAGYLSRSPTPAPARPTLPDPTDAAAPIADRARAYLDANCANCHRPGGSGRSDLDLRFAVPLEETGLLQPPLLADLGIAGARRLRPGDPGASIVHRRMLALDGNRMPPLATSAVDTFGSGLVRDWIAAMQATAVLETGRARPTDTALRPSYPNPFNAATTIRFVLGKTAQTELAVYNLAGQRLRLLHSGRLEAGPHQTAWDGRDQGGDAVSSGIYFLRLRTPAAVRTGKVLLLR